MKKLFLFLLLIPFIGISQNRDYFTYLHEYKYKIFAQPVSKDASNVSFDDYGEPVYPVIFTKINPTQTEDLLVCYTDGASGDPAYQFYKENKGEYDWLFTIAGTEIFIPGNGFIYVNGHTNNVFDKRKKFKFTGSGVEEVAQPYYYVGLKTKALTNIQLYSDYKCSQKLAVIGANSDIEVLVAEFDETCEKYLIKTPFGLVGWWKLDQAYPESNEVDGLFYSGD